MNGPHEHPPDAACTPACPGWAEGSLHLFHLKQRYAEMLSACRTASGIECVIVAPSVPGTLLPEYLSEEALVRLNLLVGRDTSEVLLDEWGIRCDLTFRGRRFDCAIPWTAVYAGILRPPERKRLRFDVIAGGKKD